MNYASPNLTSTLPADTAAPPRPPSLGSYALALAFVLSILGGATGATGILYPIATCCVVAAMFMGLYEVGLWAYRRFRHGH